MSDEVTEVTTESWGSRIGNSIKGVVTGLAMFLISFGLLFWNEGRAVKRAKALEEGKSKVVSIKVDTLDTANEGKLIHGTAKAETKDVVSDPDFAISENAIALIRNVQIYQWTETSKTTKKKKTGGSVEKKTTYTYKKKWVDNPVSSSDFKKQEGHENVGTMKYDSTKFYASDVNFGAFKLTEEQIATIGNAKKLPVPAKDKLIKTLGNSIKTDSTYVYIPFNAAQQTITVQIGGQDVTSTSSSEPAIGDLRVSFMIVKPHDISVVGVQTGENLTAYVAENGEQVFMLEDGVKSAQQMFADAEDANALMTWILRLVGFLLMFFGLKSILAPITVLADVLPILGDIADVGTGLISGLISIPLTLITIAIAWIFYRPVLGIIILILAAVILYFAFSKLRKNRAAKNAVAA